MSPLLLAAGPLSLNTVEVDVGSAMKAGLVTPIRLLDYWYLRLMKAFFTALFVAGSLSAALAQGIEFETDWAKALDRAKSEKKPMLIDFYTDWCVWCKVQDTTTWKDVNVARFANNYLVAVKLDAEREGGAAAMRFRPRLH